MFASFNCLSAAQSATKRCLGYSVLNNSLWLSNALCCFNINRNIICLCQFGITNHYTQGLWPYHVKRYMMISAYGMMLVFSSKAAALALVPYPPFGLATVSFFGLSSFLLFIGIYSSAISVAEDSQLRKSIRRYAVDESRLLDALAWHKWRRRLRKKY